MGGHWPSDFDLEVELTNIRRRKSMGVGNQKVVPSAQRLIVSCTTTMRKILSWSQEHFQERVRKNNPMHAFLTSMRGKTYPYQEISVSADMGVNARLSRPKLTKRVSTCWKPTPCTKTLVSKCTLPTLHQRNK